MGDAVLGAACQECAPSPPTTVSESVHVIKPVTGAPKSSLPGIAGATASHQDTTAAAPVRAARSDATTRSRKQSTTRPTGRAGRRRGAETTRGAGPSRRASAPTGGAGGAAEAKGRAATDRERAERRARRPKPDAEPTWRTAPGGFRPPSRAQRLRALGGGRDKDTVFDALFGCGVLGGAASADATFHPAPVAHPGDWLWRRKGVGQTFDAWAASKPLVPTRARNVLYLLPIGDASDAHADGAAAIAPPAAALAEYAAAFFTGVDVRVLPAVALAELRGVPTRVGQDGQRQLFVDPLFGVLKRRLPRDAFALAAFTMVDLTPNESWNFVFGKACLKGRVGVFSFARYDPGFYGDSRGDAKEAAAVMLRRACRVLSHEVTHMLNVKHCTYYHCRMAGSESLEQSDASPTFLCPLCLRKVTTALRCDIVRRYANMLAVLQRWDAAVFGGDVAWLRRRIDELTT